MDIANKLGDPWKFYFELDTGLQEEDKKSFIEQIGLHALPPANHTLIVYYDLLKEHGPIWITTGDEWSSHARILIGIEDMDNTNDYTNTIFVLIDPAEGKIQRIPILEFLKVFEEIAYAANREKWKNIPNSDLPFSKINLLLPYAFLPKNRPKNQRGPAYH